MKNEATAVLSGVITMAALLLSGASPNAIVWSGGLVTSFILRAPFSIKAKKQAVAKSATYALDKLMLAFNGVAILIPLVYFLSDWLSFCDYDRLVPANAWVLGAVLEILYAYFLWRSHVDLGQFWSATLEVRDKHKLVTNGVYKYVRHPMYSAFYINAIAQAILVPNVIAGFASLVAMGALWFTRIPNEEAMMLKEFGKEYEEYSKKTTRLVPCMF